MRSRTPLPTATSTRLVVAVLLIAPGLTAAQERVSAEFPPGRADLVGQRVRVHLADRAFPLIGVVTDHAGGTLRLLDEARAEHTVHTHDIASLWRSTGKDDRALWGLALGGVGGAALGAAVGAVAASVGNATVCILTCEPGFDDDDRRLVRRSALIGAAVGVPLGGLIGALGSRERWVMVPTEGSPGFRVDVHPSADGRWTLGVTVTSR